ncbi:hypothetical protein PAMP_006212 [Pampus punctatissimus]
MSHVKESGCYYSWANATNHVIANHKEKIDGLVTTNSINSLVTKQCFDKIIFQEDCTSKGIKHTAFCVTDCSTLKEDQTKHDSSTIAAAAATVAAVIVLVVSVLYCKFKENIIRYAAPYTASVMTRCDGSDDGAVQINLPV